MLWRGAVGEGALAHFAEVLGRERTWRIVGQTLWMAVAGTALSVVLGVPGAYALYRLRFPGRDALRAIATAPFVLPTVVVGVAFRALLAERGPLGGLGLDGTITAVVLAMAFFNYSVVVRTVGQLWASLDPRSAEAARTLGASPLRAFATVTLPQLGPAIAAAASIVFLFCSTAFGIVQTLGRPGYGTLETEIYVRTATFLDLRTAAVLSCLQLAIVVLAVVVANLLRRGTETSLRLRDSRERKPGRGDAPVLGLTLVVVVGLVLAPLAALLARSFTVDGAWSLANYARLATAGAGFAGGTTVLQALEHSVRIAFDAMLVALAIGVPLALVLSRRPRGRRLVRWQRLLDGAVMLPLGVSAVTVGFGFVVSLQAASPELARSGALVPLAQAVVALPIVVRLLVPVLRAIDPRQREAAATLGASPGRVLRTIDGPVLARGLGVAAGFAFAMSLGEFGATTFLARPDYLTLPVLIVRLLGRPGADNYGMAMAAAVVLAVVTGGIMLICERLRPRGAGGGGGLW
ncbi:MAG: iron ABC transporter permease [Microbacteriaceae bacterium]|nr:iron ABC transporter permease [Microbacteriaceae bacterium]